MSPSTESDRNLEHLVFEIAKGVFGETGEAFFHSLVRHLARALNADYVLLGALQPDGERIATLAAHGPGGEALELEYNLAGTPCAHVVEQNVCSYSSGVRELFPHDEMLGQVGAEGYVGSPMVDSNGRCLGLICAVTRQPLPNPKLAEALLKIFAARAGTELERKNYEEALAHGEQRFRTFVEHANEGVMWCKLEQPLSMDLSEEEQLEHFFKYSYVADCNDQAARIFGFTKAEELIGARLDVISMRSDPAFVERLRQGIRCGWAVFPSGENLSGPSSPDDSHGSDRKRDAAVGVDHGARHHSAQASRSRGGAVERGAKESSGATHRAEGPIGAG